MEGLQQVLGVMVVFGLLGGTLWWLRRRGLAHVSGLTQRRKAGILQNVDCLPLSAGNSLHLVRVADRAILIACSPAGCQLVESGPWAQMDCRLPEVKS
jgi:flagellar biogenesis protein FliO